MLAKDALQSQIEEDPKVFLPEEERLELLAKMEQKLRFAEFELQKLAHKSQYSSETEKNWWGYQENPA